MIVPKAADPKVPFAAPNCGVLVTLNTSARTSMAVPALTGMRRLIAMSRFRYAGPRTGLRDALPSVNAGAVLNTLVLNQRLTDRSSDGSSGSPVMFGRCVPNPANRLLLVACVTAIGTPDCSVTMPESIQSLTRTPRNPPGS